jgi:peptide deformylase
MEKHSDFITHINNKEDIIYLKNKHFPVNMRLFKTSKEYKDIILSQCKYIEKLCLNEKEGYKKPHGMSSANAGLSFNIIGITCNRNTKNEYCKIMINPIINEYFGDQIISKSNCGSLTLKESINIKRSNGINVTYYDINGDINRQDITRKNGSLSIQHEIDHNLGILIIDRI